MSANYGPCRPEARAGIGLRAPHVGELLATRPDVPWLEVHPENYMMGGAALASLETARRDYPVSFHGVGLSLGSAGAIDRLHLERLKTLVDRIEPCLVSEHLSWSTSGGAYLNHLLPLPYTDESLAVVASHIHEVQATLGHSILIENPSSYLRFRASTIPEPEFLTELARRTGCRLLCAIAYLDVLPAGTIGEIHVAGHARNDADGQTILIDDHGSRVAPPVWALYREALQRFGAVPTLVEWDTDIPELTVLLAEARTADGLLEAARTRDGHARAA